MCGALRRSYQVGDYFVPVASIRGEGTSIFTSTQKSRLIQLHRTTENGTNVLDTENTPLSYWHHTYD